MEHNDGYILEKMIWTGTACLELVQIVYSVFMCRNKFDAIRDIPRSS